MDLLVPTNSGEQYQVCSVGARPVHSRAKKLLRLVVLCWNVCPDFFLGPALTTNGQDDRFSCKHQMGGESRDS